MTTSQNHYEVLGVSKDASESEIEKAFYQKVREHPPEQDQEGHERIREAYDVLSNPVSRREYDNMAAHGEKIEQLKDEADQILNREDPDFEKAIKKLKEAVVLGPEIGLLRNYLGQTYLQNGNPEDALAQFEEAADLDETNTAYHLNRGHALRRLDRLGEAERTFRSAWEKDKGDYAAARALAEVLSRQEEFGEAHEVLDIAIWADDKLDFEDFFCYYDKLQLYVAQGRTDALKDELETVKGLPETEDDRKYAAFMLSQTGQMLADGNAYRLAQEFVDAAVELDPENPHLQAAQDFVRQNAEIEQSFEEVAESSSIHDFVKHVVTVFYQQYLGVVEREKAEEQIEEINAGLPNVMGVDPDNAEIKESVRHIRDQYPEVFKLSEEAFDIILSMPEASDRIDDCPHCSEPVRFEKGVSARGTCGGCGEPIKIKNGKVKKEYNSSRNAAQEPSAEDIREDWKSRDSTSKAADGRASESEALACIHDYDNRNVCRKCGWSKAELNKINTSAGNEGCFVATTVYGDYDHPDVRKLRHFRDNTLHSSPVGRAFITWYYRHGPGLAKQVEDHFVLKRGIRWILKQFVKNWLR